MRKFQISSTFGLSKSLSLQPSCCFQHSRNPSFNPSSNCSCEALNSQSRQSLVRMGLILVSVVKASEYSLILSLKLTPRSSAPALVSKIKSQHSSTGILRNNSTDKSSSLSDDETLTPLRFFSSLTI